MNFDPVFLASARSDEELMERIDNRQKYMPETIEVSLEEMQRRGRHFSDEELQYISEDIAARRANADAVSGRPGLFNNDYKNVIVEDPDAPQMYSTLAIYLFTFFFGALFGSIMMAMNISKTGRGNAVAGVLLFGLGFSVIVMCLLSYAAPGGFTQLIASLIAAYCMNYLFWRPYIGFSTFYRARPIWVPLIIGLILVALLVVGMLYSPTYNKGLVH
jgi:hypothetical protein